MLSTSSETLLIVDDEPLMTSLFSQSMSKRGYQVLTAASGAEALEIVKREGETIRVVITDMTMPGMDGMQLAQALAQQAPQIKVLLSTGHEADNELLAQSPNIKGIVQKPYQSKVLAEKIRLLLEAPP